jgi:hypothetical protein
MFRPLACLAADPPEKVSSFINADTVTWNRVVLEKFFIPMDVE